MGIVTGVVVLEVEGEKKRKAKRKKLGWGAVKVYICRTTPVMSGARAMAVLEEKAAPKR
jgi:hypothetical protein